MSLAKARRGVDFLFEAAGPQKELSLIFFGGEPMLEVGLTEELLPAIREKDDYPQRKSSALHFTQGDRR
jgi:sulfatase maturation enzyme AslB (radical SAM superfamily)